MRNRCAVVGCANNGIHQLCIYDGRYHHHGRIHYDCPRAQPTALVFDESDWHLICPEHYDVLVQELMAREGEAALRE